MTTQLDAPPIPDTPTAPEPEETEGRALFIEPTMGDRAARRADPARDMPVTPDAPYGWMTDPKTGEVRPRKTAGRQLVAPKGKRARKPPPEPPRNRAANKPRTAPPPPAALPAGPVAAADHARQVDGLLQFTWTAVAAMPPAAPGTKVLGMDMGALSIRARAGVAVMMHHRAELAYAGGAIADHVPLIARGVEAMSREDGAAWVFPVMMTLIPFATAMAEIARRPLAELAPLAQETTDQFRAMAKAQMDAAAAQAAAAQQNGHAAPAPLAA